MHPATAARTLKTIAGIQLAGGVLGALLAAVILPKLAVQANVSLLTLLPWMVPPFALSLIAGVLLWRGGGVGEVLSLINLGLQIPVLDTSFLSYFFNSGVALRVWVSSNGPGWFLFLGSQFHINLRPTTTGILVGVNVVAVLLLALLIVAMPEDVTTTTQPPPSLAHSA
jgi:hypothetical protein